MEDFSYGKEIRINDLSEWLIGKVKLHAENSRKLYTKSNDYGIKGGSFSALASFLQQGIAYAYLISEVLKSNVSIGEFTMYIGGVTAFSGALREVMSTIIEVGQFRQYYDALETYLNVEPKMRENEKLPVDKIKHTIEFKNVWFKYTKSENYALKNINIKITQGEKISIIGENGSGKTTFVKLLCRIYDPSGGEIFLDGVNIKQIDYDEYMRLFSTVFQDYKLFSFSLLENVALGKGETGNNISVQSALSQAGFGERLNTLCDGVNTFVYKNFSGEGFEPSGGEGQKIALARAIYKDAPFVILDEPTSALDPKAEYEMYMNFNKIVSEDKLAVYISHRLASTKFCDRILVFHEGCIIEKGTHKDLLRARGKYHSLYKMQRDMYY
jgi:ATP-binding cassette subfamily B protein/ATP-binding cassette subfamily C protein